MSLNRLFWFISLALMLLFSVLTARIVMLEWGAYARGAYSTEAVRVVQLAMTALEKVSAERGPTNTAMGGDAEVLLAERQQLTLLRGQADMALTDLLAALRRETDGRYVSAISKVESVQQALLPARLRVDRQSDADKGKRSAQEISRAVQDMLNLTPPLVSMISDVSSVAVQADPELLDGLTGMRVAASLREYAGQVGSKFTVPLIVGRPLSKNEVIEIGKLYGRIEQLRTLLDVEMRSYRNMLAYREALVALDQQYFGQGFPLLDDLLRIGLVSGDYRMDAAELARRYLPTMQPILHLRDVIFIELMRETEKRNHQARNVLIGVVALALFAFLCFFVLLYLVRQRVLQPVLKATDLVVGLAEDRFDSPIPQARYADEVGDMLRALHVLKARSLERISLASERETLIEQLQISSNTDFLTGALNRRAFFTHSEQQLAIAQRYGRNLALILLDIDHFKRINDLHGHLAGDNILRSAVTMISKVLRKMDILARYGGEEFIILVPEADLEQGMAVADKLRAELIQGTFAIDDAGQIVITASFGVSALRTDESLDELIRRADEALYAAKDQGRNRVVRAN
jgi:diguanylate cyclase (GGDEF)-like protein